MPDLVATFTTPPPARPYSAVKLLVRTLNSCTESSGTDCPTVAVNRLNILSAIEKDVRIGRARAVNGISRTATAVVVFRNVARSRDQIVWVARHGRQVHHLLGVDARRYGLVFGVDGGHFRRTRNLTVVDAPVTPSLAETSFMDPTPTLTRCVNFWKPFDSTVTSYTLGGKLVMAYSPADLVVVVRTNPVSVEVAVTVAPTTTAPVLSVTVPIDCP